MDSKKMYIGAAFGLLLVLALLWLIVRACTLVVMDENKVYYIGRDSTWHPIDLRGRERAMVGFTNELIQAVSEQEGFQSVIFEVGTHALLEGLNIGRYDAVLSSLPPNAINRRRYAFSDSFYLVGPVLVVKEGSEIRSFDDMEGRILGLESGALQVYNMPDPPGIIIIPYDSAAGALQHLDEGIIDAVFLDALRAHVWTEGFYAGRLKVATSPLTDRGLRVVALNRPNDIKWISRFNAGLKVARESGLYDRLIKKWGLIKTEIPDSPKTNVNVVEEKA